MLLLLLNNRVSNQNENRGLGLGFFVSSFFYTFCKPRIVKYFIVI